MLRLVLVHGCWTATIGRGVLSTEGVAWDGDGVEAADEAELGTFDGMSATTRNRSSVVPSRGGRTVVLLSGFKPLW